MGEKNNRKYTENGVYRREILRKKLPELLKLAEKKENMLGYEEIDDFLKDVELPAEALDKVMDYLESKHVDVRRIRDESMILIEDNGTEEMEADVNVDKLDLSVPDGVSLEDPVRMYLKEIGKISLLSKEEEIALGKAIEEGAAAQERINLLKEQQKQAVTWEEIKELQKKADQGAEAKKRLTEASECAKF